MPKVQGRRRFLQKSAALAGLAVAPASVVLGSPAAAPNALPLVQGDGTVDDVNSTEADGTTFTIRTPRRVSVKKGVSSSPPIKAA